jgi:arginyl-tRNA synthetase
MAVFLHLRETLADAIAAATEHMAIAPADIMRPPKPEMGDFAWSAFAVAKARQQNPVDVAHEVAAQLAGAQLRLVARVEASGPYVNFILDTDAVMRELFVEIDRSNGRFGCVGAHTSGENIIFEYSGLNTHKEVHIGHLRNHAIGSALVSLWRSQGHEVHPVNFTNDMGVHVAKCLWWLMRTYGGKIAETDPVKRMEALADVYVEASNAFAQAEESGDTEARQEVSRILLAIEEDPASPAYALWKETRQWSLDGFAAVYKESDIEFEQWFLESAVKMEGKKRVTALLDKGIAVRSHGAIIVDLTEPEQLDIMVLLKSDGTGLYATTDIALMDAKFAAFPDATRSVVLTDMRQAHHFAQLFAVLRRDGATRSFGHIGYELVTTPEGMMSSRKGTIVRYRDLRDALIARSSEELRERHPEWNDEQVAQTAQAVAFGAMKFTMLTVGSNQKVVFDMASALSLTGMSALYLQYSYARIRTLLMRIAKAEGGMLDTPLVHPTERAVLLHLLWFADALAIAAAENDPSVLTRYLYELCQKMSTCYEVCRVVEDTGEVHQWRASLHAHTGEVLAQGLTMLGIPIVYTL